MPKINPVTEKDFYASYKICVMMESGAFLLPLHQFTSGIYFMTKSDLTISNLRKALSTQGGDSAISDDVLEIIIEEVLNNPDGAVKRIENRLQSQGEDKVVFFLLGFTIGAAIAIAAS
jgi:hypothetical protein